MSPARKAPGSSAIPREAIERAAMRVALRWIWRDLEAFRRGAEHHYREARAALRAARVAAQPLECLLQAEAHRTYARRNRVRARFAQAVLEPTALSSVEFAVRRAAYVQMMCGFYRSE